MTNVTRDKKIVWELSEPGPIPGCNVLVFEQEGGGRKLRCEIPPDGSFEKNWWEKVSGVRKPLISYAVQRSESLSHRFSRIFQAVAGQGSVTVHMVVLFRIADERRVIEELSRDPLRQLEERVAQLAERSIRRLDWRQIEEEKLDLEHVILGSKSRSDGGGILPHSEILEAFAQSVGIELLAVNIHWDLPERVLDVLEIVQDKERQRAVTRKQHEVDTEKELLAGARTRLAIDGDRLRQYREKLKHDAELNQKLAGNVADGLGTAIGRIAEDVTTVSKLREAMAELNQLSGRGAGPAFLTTGASAALGASIHDATDHGTFLPPAATTDPTIEQVQAVLGIAVTVADDELRNGFLAAALSLLGEGCRSSSIRDSALVDRWAGDLDAVVGRLFEEGCVKDPDQRETLMRIQELAADLPVEEATTDDA